MHFLRLEQTEFGIEQWCTEPEIVFDSRDHRFLFYFRVHSFFLAKFYGFITDTFLIL